MIVAYGYIMEAFMSFFSGDEFEHFMMVNRASGPYARTFWVLVLCNILIPQAIWSSRVRRNHVLLWFISLVINVGMWLERYVIVVTSLTRDFTPSAWHMYGGTKWDYMTFIGTLCLFLFLIFLFLRFLPMISMAEIRRLVAEEKGDSA
jgi:molybdopterin-containing oxidoreductase family membrane subunit